MISLLRTAGKFRERRRALAEDRSGQDMIEYALLAAAVAVLVAAALPTGVYTPISTLFSSISSAMSAS
ncbi:MAG: Flp family type IVb pilin [Acidobacteria bacterium]|nr:Flp family type IVb pilin [Acidobacteriota bacterium]